MYVTQGFHRALQQHPDRIATRFGDRTRTFRQLIDRVARLAAALQALGMKTGDRVGDAGAELRSLPRVPDRGDLGRRRAQPVQHALVSGGDSLLARRLRDRHPPGRRYLPRARPRAEGEGEDRPRDRPLSGRRRQRRAAGHARLRDLARAPPADRGRPPQLRRSGRHLLHGRHHRRAQGRDAQSHQPGHLGDVAPRRRHRHSRWRLSSRRADVPPRRRRHLPSALDRRQRAQHGRGLQPAGRPHRDRARQGHRRAPRAHDGADARR